MVQNFAVAWNWTWHHLARISDPILRNAIMAELRRRAIRDWGFDPETGDLPKTTPSVELDDWEKDLLADIECYNKFKVDMRKTQRESEEREFRKNMHLFVRHGGKYSDIPENIQSPYILHAYIDALLAYGRELDALIDSLQGEPR